MKTPAAVILVGSLFVASCDLTPPSPGNQTSNPGITSTQPLADPSTVDDQPVVIRYGEVAYPRFARDAGLEGTVVISAHVTDIGNVDTTQVIESSGTQSLDESVKMAAMQYKYRPAIVGGRPVECWVKYSVTFDLP